MTGVRPLQKPFWFRLRFQVLMGILIAAIFPYLVRLSFIGAHDLHIHNNTLIGTMAAIVIGAWLMRNVGTYPGSEAIANTLSSFFGAFGILLIIFIFSRLSYNRVSLFAGFSLSLFWFCALAVREQRRRLKIGVLPFGNFSSLQEIPNVSWRALHSPQDDINDLDAIAADLRIDLPTEWDRQLTEYALTRVPVYHTKHLIESLTGRVELEHLSENSFGSLVPRQDYMTFKHIVDWVVALLAGVILFPFLLFVGLLVRLTSKGPILFRQERIGYLGKPFMVYKFRTMQVEQRAANDERDLAITREGDSRVTKFGRFLRKSRIDELPQIMNILKGEMSWIGPRPEAAILSHWYEEEIPFYRYRHIVRPGIAGWAQVRQGHVADVEAVNSKLHYDFYYIKQYSPWIDLLIVMKTIRTMLTGFGAR